MEQVYASEAPTIVAAADYQGMYIAGVIAAYALPGFYLFAHKKGLIYLIWLMCATTSIVMFFINYANFCNMISLRYLVDGINTTTSIDDSSSTCAETTLCYYQTIGSELTYNGQLYAVATFTNYYYYQPTDPISPTTQKFAPWDPLNAIDSGGIIPAVYLAITGALYSVVLWLVFTNGWAKQYVNLQEENL